MRIIIIIVIDLPPPLPEATIVPGNVFTADYSVRQRVSASRVRDVYQSARPRHGIRVTLARYVTHSSCVRIHPVPIAHDSPVRDTTISYTANADSFAF